MSSWLDARDRPRRPRAAGGADHPRAADPDTGWVLICVKAFGLNRSETCTRLGLARGVTFSRVPGIEPAGVVAACPGGEFRAPVRRHRGGASRDGGGRGARQRVVTT